MMKKWIDGIMSWLFGSKVHAITTQDVRPAARDQEKTKEAFLGRVALDHNVTKAELAVADMYSHFADNAAKELGRR